MKRVWKQKRPNWCKHKNCIFKKRHQDSLCGGKLIKPQTHEGDFNSYRFCIRFEDGNIIDISCNDSDLDYFRSIFDVLDGKKTSWLTINKKRK